MSRVWISWERDLEGFRRVEEMVGIEQGEKEGRMAKERWRRRGREEGRMGR